MRENDDKIDALEAALFNECELVNMPVKHTFVSGMYIREIFMPKGENGIVNVVTSMVHNTEHPYFVMKGKVAVFSDNEGEEIIEAPFMGITRKGTRRVLRIIEDVVWATVHRTDIKPENESEEAIEKAVALIGEQILEKHENKYLGGTLKNNVLNKQLE